MDRRWCGWFVAGVLVAASCSSSSGGGGIADTDGGPDTSQTDADGKDVGVDVEPPAEPIESGGDCDPLSRVRCALPWPSNQYLESDTDRETGYTLSFGETTLPANEDGRGVDPEPYRRLDGYGVGTPIFVAFDDLDVSSLPDETAIEESMAEGAKILLYRVDGEGLERVPYWAELDAQAPEEDGTKMLIVRPAVILEESARYVVAMRGLERTDGSAIEASEAFQRLKDGRIHPDGPLAPRQERFDEIFSLLRDQGVSIDSLTLAWDFHTASSDALHGSMLHMRDRGLDIVGERGPKLTIEEVTRFVPEEDDSGLEQRDHVGLRIEGTFRVPRFVEETEIRSTSGWTFHRGAEGRPEQNGWKESPFWMIIPHSAINVAPEEGEATGDGDPHGLVQYGHGLLGTGAQTDGGFNARIAQKHGFAFFGSTLFGMARDDRRTALGAVGDLDKFRMMADRLHQGMLEYLLLMRAMKERFPETELAQKYGLEIDPDDAYYSGISQGGIFGGTYMALTTDVRRGHLGVPGQNYSTLLGRSVDFEPFFEVMRLSYPDRLDQLLALATLQLLWGQTDPVSYLDHIKDAPFEGTPEHDILLAPAKGDYQVAVITNEVTARSDNQIELMSNYPKEVALVDEQSFPYKGSGVVLYDFGNPWPEPGNHPPEETPLGDPHGEPRYADWHNRQMVEFFRTGQIVNTCDTDGDPVCDPQ